LGALAAVGWIRVEPQNESEPWNRCGDGAITWLFRPSNWQFLPIRLSILFNERLLDRTLKSTGSCPFDHPKVCLFV